MQLKEQFSFSIGQYKQNRPFWLCAANHHKFVFFLSSRLGIFNVVLAQWFAHWKRFSNLYFTLDLICFWTIVQLPWYSPFLNIQFWEPWKAGKRKITFYSLFRSLQQRLQACDPHRIHLTPLILGQKIEFAVGSSQKYNGDKWRRWAKISCRSSFQWSQLRICIPFHNYR